MPILKKLFDGIASFAKVILISGRPAKAGNIKTRPLIIMANGPSLRDCMSEHKAILKDNDTLAVNYAANTEAFRQFRPCM